MSLQVHLLGQIDLDRLLHVQRQLVDRTSLRGDGRMTLLLCEHRPIISIGRGGSRADIRLSPDQLRHARIETLYVKRGGGCVAHGPGQLAVYAVVPLAPFGGRVGLFMRRLRAGIDAALLQLGFFGREHAGSFGVWGRTGQLASLAVAVSHGVAHHGAFINVAPARMPFQFVEPAGSRVLAPGCPNRAGSLLAEHGKPVKMASLRAAVVEQLARSLGCDEYQMHTGIRVMSNEQ